MPKPLIEREVFVINADRVYRVIIEKDPTSVVTITREHEELKLQISAAAARKSRAKPTKPA